MTLIEIIDPVEKTIELTNVASEKGVSSLLSGLMVLTFIVMGSFILKVIYSAISKMTDSINDITQSNNQLIIQNTTILRNLTLIIEKRKEEELKEQTKWNARNLIRISFDGSIVELMTGVVEILTQNHIADKKFTQDRVHSLVNVTNSNRIRFLNDFTYDKIPLDEYTNNKDLIQIQENIIINNIHVGENNKDIILRELNLFFRDYYNSLTLNSLLK